jgi:ABC-type transporter Mla subunit MlaD
MRTRSLTGTLATSPTVVGAVTVLVAVVAVFLSYNANQGLPFVPVYRVSVDIPNASRLIGSNEVRIGGSRVGVVETVTPREDDDGQGSVARVTLKLDRSAQPLPRDSIFRVRYLSTFGLKYVEVVRGTGPPAPEGYVFDGSDDGETCELPVDPATFAKQIPASARNGCFQTQAEFDDLVNGVDADAREDTRTVLAELGAGVAGRGVGLGAAIEAAPGLLEDVAPVARTLAARPTRLARFIRALERAAGATAPVSSELAQGFANAAVSFEAISRDPAALQDTISGAVPLVTEGPARLARARALLADTAELARRLGPGARDLVRSTSSNGSSSAPPPAWS